MRMIINGKKRKKEYLRKRQIQTKRTPHGIEKQKTKREGQINFPLQRKKQNKTRRSYFSFLSSDPVIFFLTPRKGQKEFNILDTNL